MTDFVFLEKPEVGLSIGWAGPVRGLSEPGPQHIQGQAKAGHSRPGPALPMSKPSPCGPGPGWGWAQGLKRSGERKIFCTATEHQAPGVNQTLKPSFFRGLGPVMLIAM